MAVSRGRACRSRGLSIVAAAQAAMPELTSTDATPSLTGQLLRDVVESGEPQTRAIGLALEGIFGLLGTLQVQLLFVHILRV